MIENDRGYQRAHLRAPYQEPILFGDEGYVHKGRGLNLSEGGILLDQVPSFPAEEEVPLMLHIPAFPYFKNFSLIKMQTYSKDLFTTKVIRARGRMVRRIGTTTSVDEIFKARFGIKFVEIGAHEQKIIADYVSVFASNLIYLQMLIDSWNTDEDIKLKTRSLANILGYSSISRIAELRFQVSHDYKSLQWL
jgi:hypothetical protein